MRSDGALYSQEWIECFERKGHTYPVSAKVTSHLHEGIKTICEDQWLEGQDDRGRPHSMARISYRPKTSKRQPTYIISRRLKHMKGQKMCWGWARYKYFAYVTSYRAPLLEQFRFCV